MEQKVYISYNGDEIEIGTVADILAVDGTRGLDPARATWLAVADIVHAIFYDDYEDESVVVSFSIR